MPRPKKPTYEYVPRLQRYRKRIKDIDGKYVSIYGKTPEELEAKLVVAEQSITEGKSRAAAPTVAEYVEQWIALNTPGMKYSHKTNVLTALRQHVVPIIGSMRLTDVKPDDAQRVMTAAVELSKSMNDKILQSMRKVFDAARRNGLIASNPCDELKAGGKKAKRIKPLTPTQVDTLLEAVDGTPVETFVRIALYAGLRREEVLGLQWRDIDLESEVPSLTVERKVAWGTNQPLDDEELKSEAAYRTIPIPPQLADHLRERKTGIENASWYVLSGAKPATKSQWKNLWGYVEARQTGELTYVKRSGGKKERVTFMREFGAKSRGGNFYYTIDFDVTPHQLRHTYCTNLILGGANVKRVQYLMGHADIKVTLEIYTQLIETSPEALVGDVNLAFGVKSEVKR